MTFNFCAAVQGSKVASTLTDIGGRVCAPSWTWIWLLFAGQLQSFEFRKENGTCYQIF